MEQISYYKLFLEFIDTYLPGGFLDINPEDPLVRDLNELLLTHKQHFHVADMLDLRILFVSSTIRRTLGIEPEEYTPKNELELQHPEDLERFTVVRSKFITLCTETFNKGGDFALMSTNSRFRHADGLYKNFLVQGYVISQKTPKPSVYALAVITDIEWFGPIKHGYNYYLGDDLSYFRFPDKELIETGCMFTDREFEILEQIRLGLDSKSIGDKLFISPHTVDTHRRNMLKKTGKTSTHELILHLQKGGFF